MSANHRTDPTVSVVIPAKDDAELLARCLAALAAQTRRPDEVVVVDNGSSDGTARVARDAGARTLLCPEKGIPAASAAGYDAATGDLVLRLDADCVPAAEWVERVVAAFEAWPEVGAITGGATFIDGPRWLRGPLARVYLGAYVAASAPALGHVPLFGSNLALRRRVWDDVRAEVHRHDPEVHDDLDLSFHVGERHVIRYRTGLGMRIAMRPFDDLASFAVRFSRGFRSVLVHWPRDFPPARWLRLASRSRQRPESTRMPRPRSLRI
ncbi:glycosyltransferase family 2 protein [Microbacterium flavescens]|uniref:glycosyltransferase family 2 protein n=1 Tax=Microbacterium flavescens TaxID=69366 RepID=UPI001BDE6031|nr:glycosyltransferase family 2 protein [Microbacterium flavescens]